MKLSFLITYHNEGAWLSECLQSIVPQLRDHLATYGKVDIALDPFPQNGGTTSLDTCPSTMPMAS